MKLKAFIADVDVEHVEKLRMAFQRGRQIEIVGTSGNGNDALGQIVNCKPHLLFTDVQLPGLDGIMLLRDLQALKDPPAAIVCTRFYSDICVSNACRYGANYVMYKPLDYGRIEEIALECWRTRQRPRASLPIEGSAARLDPGRIARIRSAIRDLGIPARMNGAHYLAESILRLDDNYALIRNLSKGLYAEIAELMDTTPSGVERSMRSAIGAAYARGSMTKRFDHCPTNKEFIEYLHQTIDNAVPIASEPVEKIV